MRPTPMCVAAVILAVSIASVPAAADDPLCTPVSDNTVTPVLPAGSTLLYVKFSSFMVRNVPVPVVGDVWRETNDIPGLQTSEEMACGAAADFHWIDTGL